MKMGDHSSSNTKPAGSRSYGASHEQSTKGVGVTTGLSSQDGFHDASNRSMGLDTRKNHKNQVPIHPKKGISTDRGKFTFY